MRVTRWTPETISEVLWGHTHERSAAEDRAGEIEEEIKLLKAELRECEARSWRHQKAQHRLVEVARALRAVAA